MRVSDAKIDEIRAASDIVDVISGYVRLKKRGKSFLGLCPFHHEKTPSFTVSPEKQMYHCFGCSAGGNVFTFVMAIEKLPFPEALRLLAEKAGITIASDDRAGEGDRPEEKLYDACRQIAVHYYENLTGTTEGKLALEYFRHRGFRDETIRRFGLGYSMHSWDDVVTFAEKAGVHPDALEKAGLIIRREDGRTFYDRFRGRAMFPIMSSAGKVLGFGARKLREDDQLGKYINSPETPIYDKSRSLYGIYHSKDAIRAQEYAVLVEGYADLISVFQAGIENVVAASGTALTDEQIRLIGRYAKSITLVYDADSAGSKATMRGVDLIIENGFDVKVAALPQGEDPDSVVRKYGKEKFSTLLAEAVSFLDFKVARFQEAGLFATPEGQTRAVRSIVGTISRIEDELKRNFYIKHLAERYGIYESVLFRELDAQLGQARKRPVRPADTDRVPLREGRRPEPGQKPTGSIPAVESDLLKLMVEQGPETVRYVSGHLSEADFFHEDARRIFRLLKERLAEDKHWTPATLIDDLSEEADRQTVANLIFNKYEISKGWEEMGSSPEEADPQVVAARCIALKRAAQIDRLIGENREAMEIANTAGRDVRQFLERHRDLLREKQEILGGRRPRR
jgi:DNA primase